MGRAHMHLMVQFRVKVDLPSPAFAFRGVRPTCRIAWADLLGGGFCRSQNGVPVSSGVLGGPGGWGPPPARRSEIEQTISVAYQQEATGYAGRDGAPEGKHLGWKKGDPGGWTPGSSGPPPGFVLKKAATPFCGSRAAQAMEGTPRRQERGAFQAPTSWNRKLTGQLFSYSACRLARATSAFLFARLCIAVGAPPDRTTARPRFPRAKHNARAPGMGLDC